MGNAMVHQALIMSRLWQALLCAASLGFAAGPAIAQDAGAQEILSRYQEIRPGLDELAMYQLDWAPSLDQALKRAEKESRPIFLVVIHAQYGDIISGHC